MTNQDDADTAPLSPYEMTIDLRILNHLGIHLYSNVAAVLSEAVANAWDADAQEVKIDISKDKIVIYDNGNGMGLEDINGRFLNVGYDKRSREGDKSKEGRFYMGRKGIGKLSLFSVADTVLVHTLKDGNKHAFKMTVEGIKAAISRKETYYPAPGDVGAISISKGTRIELTQLKTKRVGSTPTALRKRIARRFSIIGYVKGQDRFDVLINGDKVSPSDREDLSTLEFLWEFGDKEVIPKTNCPKLKRRRTIFDAVDEQGNWRVSGWIGAVPEPKQLTSIEAGALNNVVVISRGRLIQENVLDKINYSRIFTKYLTGQIEADFLDLSDQDDIATSDRQRMIEDDERYQSLLGFVRKVLLEIDDEWTRWRNEARGKDATDELPELADWLNDLPEAQRTPARQMLGLVRGVDLDEESQRVDLYKAGVVAFERLRLRECAHQLGEAGALTAQKLLPLLSSLSDLEGSLYRDIVVSRLDVIRKFEGLIDQNEKEKVLQEHLFKNLWLLDPAWDRASGSERIEKKLKTDYKEFSSELTDEESKGRYDIRYQTNGGLHILVELKRAERKLHVTELMEQGQKYLGALRKCLIATGDQNPQIALIFVLGKTVYEEEDVALGKKYVDDSLKGLNARIVYFEQLIQGALQSYGEFLEKSAAHDKVENLVKRLDAKKIAKK